ncbi:RNA recognition motif domain-containing protein [Ditylenchus destructor]|nr:RNA recognition motif domain-containing protein [Ditylenchus destructor]
MDSGSIFRMVFRSRSLQMCLRNVSIPRRHHLCALSLIHISNSTLIQQETNLRRFSSFGEPSAEFSSNKSNTNNAINSACHRIDNKAGNVQLTSVCLRELTLIVQKLSPNTTNESLRAFFSKFGQLAECQVTLDHRTGLSCGFGFVKFNSQKELDSALNAQPHLIDGTEVTLDYATNEFDVIVTSLPPNVTEKALSDFFSRYGKLRRCEIKETLPGVRTVFVGFWKEKDKQSADVISKNSWSAIRTYPEEFIFSPKKHYDVDRSIFVAGLSKFTTEQSLYNYFLSYGTITGCKLARHKHNGLSKEYGFVEFESVAQAESTCKFHPHVIDDQEVNVRFGSRKELQQKFKLFIGGLSKETSVETLREYFSQFGQIAECNIPRNEVNGSRGFGFVIFKSQESVDNVINLSSHCIDNNNDVTVRLTETRQREFTLIVKKLSPNTTNESLRAFYSRFGQLTECTVKLDGQTGQSREFGYVAFRSLEGLDSALAEQPHLIDGTKVELDFQTNIFDVTVTSLPLNITEKELNEYFSRYGELRRCEIKETSPDARTGFVQFRLEKDVLQVLSDRPHIINGMMVNIQRKDEEFAVFVGNLPSDATDDSLFKTFSKFGKIVHWEVKRDHNTNRSRGYGFVSFEKAEQAVQAVSGGPYILKGKTLRVEPRKALLLSRKSIK